jgi:hypothetical protein
LLGVDELIGMRERAAMFGDSLHIVCTPAGRGQVKGTPYDPALVGNLAGLPELSS